MIRDLSLCSRNRWRPRVVLLRRWRGLVKGEARGDHAMDRCRDTEVRTVPNDRTTQGVDLKATAVFEIPRHR
jgi:hypothetical protein